LYRFFHKRGFQILQRLSLVVVTVTLFYLVFYLFLLIYEVIPKVWLRELFKWLRSLNLQLFFSIFGILFTMFLFWFIITLLQRRSATPAKRGVKTIYLREGRCGFCGARPRGGDRYCFLCGKALHGPCPACGGPVPTGASFCPNCSAKQK